MKRRDLLAHLTTHGCVLIREGSNHSWWAHLGTNRRSALPRHLEINNHLAVKICRDLGIAECKKVQ